MDLQRAQGYAKAHQNFLERNNPKFLQQMPEPQKYLDGIGQEAAEMYADLADRMHSEVNRKKLEFMDRLRELEAIPVTVDEIVMSELILQPLPTT